MSLVFIPHYLYPAEDDEDFMEIAELVAFPRQMKIIHPRPNYFESLRDYEFFDRFRLSKQTVWFVLSLIEETIRSATDWNNALTPEQKLLLTLRYYASGSMLIVCGDFMGCHKSTASRVIKEVSVAIASLRPQFICFPNTAEEFQSIKQQFFDIANFPRCIGAIDCTHVKIRSPGGPRAEDYRNRKGFFSMNVQTVCDANLKIQNIVARWPGSVHDSTIFKHSNVRARFERGEMLSCVLVGDAGYAVDRYLLTPLHEPTTQGENRYNEALIRTRNTVERSYGVWKRRFPILALGINVKYASAQSIVVATAVLHNIATDRSEKTPRTTTELESSIQNVDFNNGILVPNRRHGTLNERSVTRQQMITYFANMR